VEVKDKSGYRAEDWVNVAKCDFVGYYPIRRL